MANCAKCGFKLPEGAAFCPNCGAPAEKFKEAAPPDSIAGLLRLGLIGAFLSLAIQFVAGAAGTAGAINLYFAPSFLSALIVIYFSKLNRLKDAVIVSMTIYLFTDAIIAGMVLGTFYASNQPLAKYYGEYVPTILDVLLYTVSPITAVIAGYIGFKTSSRKGEETYFKGGGLEPALTYGFRRQFKRLKYVFLGSYKDG